MKHTHISKNGFLRLSERLLDMLSMVLAKQPYTVPGAPPPQNRAPVVPVDKAVVLVWTTVEKYLRMRFGLISKA